MNFLEKRSRLAIYTTLALFFLSGLISNSSKGQEGMAAGMLILFLSIGWVVAIFCIFFFVSDDENLAPKIEVEQKRWSNIMGITIGVFILVFIISITTLVFLGVI